MKRYLSTSIFIVLFSMSAHSGSDFLCEPNIDLKEIESNPEKFLERKPVKYDETCNIVKNAHSFLFQGLSQDELILHEYVEAKDKYRSKFQMETDEGEIVLDIEGRAGEAGNDKHYNLVDGLSASNQGIVNIYSMDEGLTSGNVANKPWSDDYWPIGKGILAYRYADQDMVSLARRVYNSNPNNLWISLFNFSQTAAANPNNFVERRLIKNLSPSEKYDLLVGDSQYNFTQWMWKQGEQYYNGDANGDGQPDRRVELWMGICHGWAPASYMMPRPVKSVTVISAQGGHNILFTPSDIKSLASQLWAQAPMVKNGSKVGARFIGGRCNDRSPSRDSSGRIISDKCFDNNPSSWHKSIINQVGRNHKSLILDATYDYEVWNHPIVSYRYQYFNPITKERTRSLRSAIVRTRKFRNDIFKRYRDPKARRIVGIVMEVTYAVEVPPSTRLNDSSSYDAHHTVHYTYDLEMDRAGNIIGGEWYANKHPDFLWTPSPGTVARANYEISYPDSFKNSWNVTRESVPREWTYYALPIRARAGQVYPGASQMGQPLGNIVESLFREATR